MRRRSDSPAPAELARERQQDQRTETGAQAIQRALSVLDLFSSERPSWTVREIADELGLTTSTAHRFVRVLVGNELLAYESHLGEQRRLTVGPATLRLARVLLDRDDGPALVALATPVLEHLRSLTGETAALHRVIAGQRVCVVELVSHQPVRMQTGIGGRQPLYAGAASKALLAWLPDADLRRLVPSPPPLLADGAPLDVDRLARELDEVRAAGYAMSLGETVPGAAALATPVRNRVGACVAAINVTGPIDRWNADTMALFIPALLEAAAALGASLP